MFHHFIVASILLQHLYLEEIVTCLQLTVPGGILGSDGKSQTMNISTGIQFNEGNITDVLTSKYTNDNTKNEIAKALPIIIKSPNIPNKISTKTTYITNNTDPKTTSV